MIYITNLMHSTYLLKERVTKMTEYNSEINLAASKLSEADNILVGAGAGLSESAGLNFQGTRFTNNFSDFMERYKLKDMYTSSFCH